MDWDHIKTRLDESRRRLDVALTTDTEKLDDIFRRRASQLAAPRESTLPRGSTCSMLVCKLGDERYGINLDCVAEVLPMEKCVPVPGGQHELVGVMNIRGQVRSIVDLARLLGLPESASRADGYVVLLRQCHRDLGLKVDQVDNIEQVASDALASTTDIGNTSSNCVRGLTAGGLIVLDVEAALSHPVFTAE